MMKSTNYKDLLFNTQLQALSKETELLSDLLLDIKKAAGEKTSYHLYSYILEKLNYLKERTSHFYFLNIFSFLFNLIRSMPLYLYDGYKEETINDIIIHKITLFLQNANQTLTESIERNFEYYLFIRNGKRFIASATLIEFTSLEEYSKKRPGHFFSIHSLTAGTICKAVIFPDEKRKTALLADRVLYKMSSIKKNYVKSCLMPTSRVLKGISGYFRYKGEKYFSPS
jgi:hypothetical protein